MPSNSKIFKYFLVFFIGGIFLGNFYQPPLSFFWLAMFLSVVVLAFDYKSRKSLFLFFCFLGFVLGILRMGSEIKKIYPRKGGEYRGIMQVVKEPDIKDGYSQLVLKDMDGSEKFLANVPSYPRYEYADILNVRCSLANPENKYQKFDYIKFLAKDGIYQLCKRPKIERAVVNKDAFRGRFFAEASNWYFSKLFGVKKSLENKISGIFPSPESEYLSGLILGGSDRLPKEVAESFRRTGTTHTVAVSGYNITILAEFLMALAIAVGFWRPKAFWLAVIGIVFFVAMIGSPASAVRAAVMGILLLWASKAGRLSDSFLAILLAGAVMVALSPLILVHDVGFQLSFLATLGIVLFYGPLSEKVGIKNDFLELKSIVLVTIAAQLGVLGIILYTFETFSPISLLANLIILPAVPYIMFSGFFVSILGYFSLSLAKMFSIPVLLALKAELRIIEYLAGFSWSLIDIKGLNWIFIVIYYLFFVLLVLKLRQNQSGHT